MKKYIFTSLIAFAAVVSADQSIILPALTSEQMLPPNPLLQEEVPFEKRGFFYVRFAAAESDLTRMSSILPGLGIGYRRLAGNGAADISFNGIGRAEHRSGRVYWSAPKATYIHYLMPNAKKSPYLGAGLAWGGVGAKHQHFVGIIPSVTTGYEFVRKSTVLGFAELNISQPALSVYREGAFPGPMAECTVGMGF